MLANRFAQRVVELGRLSAERRADLRDSLTITVEPQRLSLTCGVTGSTYERVWNGSESEALALADEAAEGTAYLIANTPHYPDMRSRR